MSSELRTGSFLPFTRTAPGSRTDDYEKQPPGEGWDGVYTMLHK